MFPGSTCCYNNSQLTLILTKPQGFLHLLHFNIIWRRSLFSIINSFVIFFFSLHLTGIINSNNQWISVATPHVLFTRLFSIKIKLLIQRIVIIILCDYMNSHVLRQRMTKLPSILCLFFQQEGILHVD